MNIWWLASNKKLTEFSGKNWQCNVGSMNTAMYVGIYASLIILIARTSGCGHGHNELISTIALCMSDSIHFLWS